MKKLTLLLLGCILLLAACGKNDQGAAASGSNMDDHPVSEQSGENEETDNAADDSQDDPSEKQSDEKQSGDKEIKHKGSIEDVTKMPEYRIIKGQVDIDDYQLNVVVDNQHKRIIILKNKNNHRKEYKSIFVKDNGRLKIIQFNDNGLIYDKTIK